MKKWFSLTIEAQNTYSRRTYFTDDILYVTLSINDYEEAFDIGDYF